ncbi:hypothetical protein ACFQ6V_09025 [Streptomyces roseifaciens]
MRPTMLLALIVFGLLCPLLTHSSAKEKPLLHALSVGAFIGACALALVNRDQW